MKSRALLKIIFTTAVSVWSVAFANAADIYVNDLFTTGDIYCTATGNDANPGTSDAPFLTVAMAISSAAPGDHIWVDAGIYYENLLVDKQLILTGSTGSEPSVIDGNATATVVSITANTVTLEHFTLQNSGYVPGISLTSNTNCIIKNNIVSNVGVGISLNGASDNTLQSNAISSFMYTGIDLTYNYPDQIVCEQNQIILNTVTGTEFPWYGISVSQSDENIITGNTIIGISDGMGYGCGIAFWYGSNYNVIAGNDISECDYGIYNSIGTGNSANYNKIYSNTIGLQNDDTPVVNATSNWWGVASGPYRLSDNSCGTGNSVTDNVTICNWYTNISMTPVNLNGCVTGVFSLTGGGGFCTGATGAPVGLDDSEIGVNYQLCDPEFTLIGDPIPGTGSGISFGNLPVGTYYALATNTITGCSGIQMSGNVSVTSYPQPSAAITPDPASMPAGGSISLNGNPTGGTPPYATHLWTGSTTYLSPTNVVNPTFSGAPGGTYNLTYTVTDNNGCTGSDNVTVTVIASDIYVNDNSLTGDVWCSGVGDDLNPGTPALPLRNISTALALASPGNTIRVDAGIYSEHITISKQVTVMGADSSLTFIDGGGSGDVVTITAGTVTFKAFNVQHSGSGATNAGIRLTGVTGCTLQSNCVKNNAIGIALGQSPTNTILSNSIRTNTQYGIDLYGSATNSFQTNYIAANSAGGIRILNNLPTYPSEGNIFYRNRIFGNASNGINAESAITLVNAVGNWWGNNNGPYRASDNGCGQGNAVTGNVTICTWYTDYGLTQFNGCVTVKYSVTGGGNYCAGGAGLPVGLNGSQPSASGVSYRLYCNGSLASGWTPGTGSAFNFANQFASGTYTVLASNSTTGCSNLPMTGSVTISVNSLPTGVLSGGATYCNGQNTTTSLSIAVTGTGPWNGTLSDGTAFSGPTNPVTVSVAPSSTTTYTISTLSDAHCSAIAAGKTGSATVTVNPRPTAALTGGAVYCNGQNTTTTLSVAVTGTSPWNGTLSNGTPFSGSSSPITVTVAPVSTTTYTISSLSDAKCTAIGSNLTGSATVTVNARPTAVLSGGSVYCSGQNSTTSLSISVTGTGPWNGMLSDGTPFNGSVNPISVSVNPSSTTIYSISSLSDLNCSAVAAGMTGSATITINTRPTAVLSGGAVYCNGQNTMTLLTVTVTGTGPWSGMLSDETEFNGSTSPITVAVSPVTTTTYTVSALYDTKCSSAGTDLTGSATVTVNPRPTAVLSGGAIYCGAQNTTTVLNIALTGIGPWSGVLSDGTTFSGPSSPISVSVTPVYTTTYTVSSLSDANCSAVGAGMTGSATITVNARPTAVLSGGAVFCDGQNTTTVLSLAVTGTGPWSGTLSDGTPLSGTTNPVTVQVTPSSTTIYSVTTLTDANCSAIANGMTGSATVTVNARPTGVLSGGAVYCDGQNTSTLLSVTLTGNGPWSGTLSGGTPFSGSSSPIAVSVNPASTTSYNILSLTDANCTAIASDLTGTPTVTVNPLPQPPTAVEVTACFDGAIHTGSAITGAGETLTWYDAAVGGQVTGAPAGTTPGVYIAYAAATVTLTGCESASRTPVSVTINEAPVVITAALQSALSPTGPWTSVSGTLSTGYEICISPAISNYYLDIDGLGSNPPLNAGFMNPFSLDQESLPAGWLPYWSAFGVVSGAGGWQGQMWDIINGDQPFFYIKLTGSGDYKLVDGLQYWLYEQGATTDPEPVLQVPGNYPQHNYKYTGNVTGINGCVSSFFDVFMEFNTIPTVSEASLQSAPTSSGPWTGLEGTLGSGFSMCIDPAVANYFLDINSLTIPAGTMQPGVLNAFSLDQASLPFGWLSYWSAIGVVNGAPGWQGQMWQIINGNAPFFYIRLTSGGDHILVDGLQYWIAQQALPPNPNAEPILTVPGNYPQWNYKYTGTVSGANGCTSSSFDVFMEFNNLPTATISGTQSVCSGSPALLTIALTGTPPWNVTYTANGIPQPVITGILTSPLSITVNPTENTTYAVGNVSTANGCSNAGTGSAKVFIGPVTTAGSVVNACSGSTIAIPVAVTSFAEVGAISLSLNYDPAVLTYVSFSQNPGLMPGFTVFNNVSPGPGSTGTIRAAGFAGPPPAVPITLPDGAVLFTVFFNYNGTATTTTLTWNDSPDPSNCEYAAFAPEYLPYCDLPTGTYYNNGSITKDVTPPVAICHDITVPLDNTGHASITASQVDNGSYDNACGIKSLSVSPNSFTCDDTGPNTVTLTVTDNNNNVSACTATVTILDVTPPAASCRNITIQLNSAGSVSIVPSDIDNGSSDNCSFSLSASKTTFDCSNVGTNNVTLTVTDASGNTSSCVAAVTVQDLILPVASCRNITVTLDATGNATITPAQIDNGSSDNCTLVLSASKTNFTCSDIGPNNVILTVTDPGGNSASCLAVVTVQDITPPTAVCRNINAVLDATGNVNITPAQIDNGSSDNCSFTLSASKTAFNCTDVGPNDVTLTVTDASGNSSSCIAVVTVQDITPPAVSCKNITIQLDATGNATITTAMIDNGSSDNCTFSLSASKTAFSCTDVGTNNVTLTATDASGNSASCVAVVTVQDNIIPGITCPTVTNPYFVNNGCTWTGAGLSAVTSDNCTPSLFYSINGGPFVAGDANGYPFPIGTTNVIYKVTDGANNSSTCSFSIQVQATTVSGTITYYNSATTVMNNVKINLFQGADFKYTTTTDASGHYTFPNVCEGTYDVIFSTSKSTGGINATDAALLNAWYVGPQYEIEKVRYFASDVAPPNFQILASDPGRILEYFIQSGNPTWFPRGLWTFWQPGTTISKNTPGTLIPAITVNTGTLSLTQDFYALCTGDFNRSWVPSGTKSVHPSLTLNYGETRQVDPNQEFELPIFASSPMEVTAISMILTFPSDKLEILDIYLAGDQDIPLLYAISGDEVRIGWQSLLPVSVGTEERLLTIKARIKAILAQGELVRLSLTASELNELADASYEVIDGAVLFVDVIEAATGTNWNQAPAKLTFANYPNPFNGKTTFSYTLPTTGFVTLDIYSMVGNKVKTVVSEEQVVGDHTLTFDGDFLKPGIYVVTLRLNANGQLFDRVIKIARNQ